MSLSHYKVAIIGGGISGSSLMFTLSQYTDIDSIALFEKYDHIAPLNSNAKGNSQTLHSGDIETNYTIDKAAKVKTTALMLENYAKRYGYADKLMHKVRKMVLGVGETEVAYLKERHQSFQELYPYLNVWDKDALQEREPMLIMGRQETSILGIGTEEKYSAINYGAISESFIENAQAINSNSYTFLNTEIKTINAIEGKYHLQTGETHYTADVVVVNAGAHSLMFAHNMNYGLEYSSLPIGGSFFYSKKQFLNSKVYTVQNPKLPFAAIHGDPDIVAGNRVRFGPTALALPKLERYHHIRYKEVFDALKPDMDLLNSVYDLFKDSEIRNYVLRNALFELPNIREHLFAKDVQKIVPLLTSNDLEYASGVGGLRPQVINKKTHQLLLGEAKIDTGRGIIFNMTPSPGATSCLDNAQKDAKIVCDYLHKKFDETKHAEELLSRDYPRV